ncbi:MAG: hypothetical protein ABEJ80_02580 [Halarchaeum sp.]
MAPDTTAVPSADVRAGEVMAAVDDDGGEERFVIANVDRDEAWISAPVAQTTTLHAMQ